MVSSDSAVFGSARPWAAAQYAGCGETNARGGGVNIPGTLLAGSANVSRESGEWKNANSVWFMVTLINHTS